MFHSGKSQSKALFTAISSHWVVRKVDNAIHWINHYPVDRVVCFVNTCSRDSVIHLSNNWHLTYQFFLLNLDMVTTCYLCRFGKYFQLHIRCGYFALTMSWQKLRNMA